MLTWDYYNLEELDLTDNGQVIWYLEKMIQYGLRDKKIQHDLLEKFLPGLKIPENARAFFELLLWNKRF